jgi:hypothetical protein
VEPDDTPMTPPKPGACTLYFVAKRPQPFGLIETVRTIVRYDKPGIGMTVAAFNDLALVKEYLSTLTSDDEGYALQCLTSDQLEMMLTVLRAQGVTHVELCPGARCSGVVPVAHLLAAVRESERSRSGKSS